jgi:hypothetical protein
MNKDWGNFNSLLTVLAVLYTCVFLSVLIDLFFGVRRAKRLKIVRTSFGYRRTITKLTSYFGLMIMLSIADIVASVVFDMPYFTVIGAIGIVFVNDLGFINHLTRVRAVAEMFTQTVVRIAVHVDVHLCIYLTRPGAVRTDCVSKASV